MVVCSVPFRYVYIVREPEYVQSKQAVYTLGFYVGLETKTGGILTRFSPQSEVILVRELNESSYWDDRELIISTVNQLFPKLKGCDRTFVADSWALQSVVHSILTKKKYIVFSGKWGIPASKSEKPGYLYLVRQRTTSGEIYYKVGVTHQSAAIQIRRFTTYRDYDVVMVIQTDRYAAQGNELEIIDIFKKEFTLYKGVEWFLGDWSKMVTIIEEVVLGPFKPSTVAPTKFAPLEITLDSCDIGEFLYKFFGTTLKVVCVSLPTLQDYYRRAIASIRCMSEHEATDRIHNFLMGNFEGNGAEITMAGPSPYHRYDINTATLREAILVHRAISVLKSSRGK